MGRGVNLLCCWLTVSHSTASLVSENRVFNSIRSQRFNAACSVRSSHGLAGTRGPVAAKRQWLSLWMECISVMQNQSAVCWLDRSEHCAVSAEVLLPELHQGSQGTLVRDVPGEHLMGWGCHWICAISAAGVLAMHPYIFYRQLWHLLDF